MEKMKQRIRGVKVIEVKCRSVVMMMYLSR
jgi:hypothetical protein